MVSGALSEKEVATVTQAELLVHLLEGTRKLTLLQVQDLTDAEMAFQPRPGLNNALWLLGHIVTSEDGLILRWCAGDSAMPEEYRKLFFMGTTPQSDPSAYPGKDEILEVLAQVHTRALEVVSAISPGELDEQPMGYEEMPEGARELFWCKGACIYGHARHEAVHAGQITMLRRLMGKPFRV